MRRIPILLVAILSGGCARRASPDTSVLVACPAPAIPAADSREARMLEFTLRLPVGFVQESGLYCEHGGEQYVRGQDRIGYCHGMFDAVAPAPGEEAFTLAGRAAVLRCARSHRGWRAGLALVGPATTFGTAVNITATDRATLAELLGALQNAKPPGG